MKTTAHTTSGTGPVHSRLLAAGIAVLIATAGTALGQHGSFGSAGNSGSNGGPKKGHNEQGRLTGPGGATADVGSNGNQGSTVGGGVWNGGGDDDGKMTSGGGGFFDAVDDLIDGPDEAADRMQSEFDHQGESGRMETTTGHGTRLTPTVTFESGSKLGLPTDHPRSGHVPEPGVPLVLAAAFWSAGRRRRPESR